MMNIIKAIFKAVMGSPGKVAITHVKYPVQDIVKHNKESIDHTNRVIALEKKLEAAADALRQIECRTNDPHKYKLWPLLEIERIHEIAQNGYRAAKDAECTK